MVDVRFACSNKPRITKPSAKRGKGWWEREVYHALRSGMSSECGRDASEWLRIDDLSLASAITDPNLCARCASKLRLRYGTPLSPPGAV